MEFGDIFGRSWQEYKDNFKVFAVIFLLLSVIPVISYYLISIPYNLEILKLGATPTISETLSVALQAKYLIPIIILFVIIFVLGLLMSVSFVYNALYRKKEMSVRETLAGGKKYFWKYFWFSIVYFIFIALLFLLFIIPGIIFSVFWAFALYVLVGENKGILESLKTSHNLIRGKWWRVFGYLLLFMLIAIAISLGFSIAAAIVNIPITLLGGAGVVPSVSIITSLISSLFNLGANLIVAPLTILFAKNFYLDMKKESWKTEKKK